MKVVQFLSGKFFSNIVDVETGIPYPAAREWMAIRIVFDLPTVLDTPKKVDHGEVVIPGLFVGMIRSPDAIAADGISYTLYLHLSVGPGPRPLTLAAYL